jgi:sugar/nucleoside kinase (ribokinase family)
MAGICDTVKLVSLLGATDSREDFIRGNLKPNVDPQFFYRDDGPTIVKKRYINQYLNQKLFEVNYLAEDYIGPECEARIIDYLTPVLPEYDLVVVSDFGHGFISRRIIEVIEERSRLLAVNTQTNSANTGFNMITKYSRPNLICLDEPEIRLAAQERFEDIEDITRDIFGALNTDCMIVTLGKKGSIGINRNGGINRTPIFSSRVIDTVGAGDAFFAYAAPSYASGMPLDMVSFIGNAVGALAVQIVGNKSSVEKYELLEFINGLLK